MTAQSEWVYVYHHLATMEPRDRPAPLYDIIVEVLRTRLGEDLILSEKKAVNRLNRYLSFLEERVQRDKSRGVIPYVVVKREAKLVSWNQIQISKDDNRAARSRKIRLQRRPNIVKQIRNLDPTQFEYMFRVFDKYCRVLQYEITRKSGDFGIDAMAIVENFSIFGFFAPRGISHKLIVQSKKYASSIAREKVQNLNDSVNLVRARSSSVLDVVPHWFWSSDGTIAGWLIADKGFQKGAVEYAKSNGILVSDVYDVASIICLGPNFDPYSSHDLKALLK